MDASQDAVPIARSHPEPLQGTGVYGPHLCIARWHLSSGRTRTQICDRRTLARYERAAQTQVLGLA